jgi:prevent-host-death family protein
MERANGRESAWLHPAGRGLNAVRTVRTVSVMKRSPKPTSRGAEEARQQLPAILDAAAAGRTTVITRHGREVAAVVPAASIQRQRPASLLALAGSGRGLWGGDGGDTIDRLRDEWNR